MTDDLKPEGVRGLLLGPLVLLTELVGALIPGTLFVLLLIAKRVPEATAAVGTSLIGYRTKIACGLVISFVIGRLFYIPVTLLQARLLSFDKKDLALYDSKKEGGIFDKLTKEGKQLLGGPLVAGFLRGASPWEHVNVANSEMAFRLSTGFVLVVASMIPGDGRMRAVELVAGLFFAWFGVLYGRQVRGLVLALLGASAVEGLLNLSEPQQQLVLAVAKILLSSQPKAAAQSPSIPKAPDSGPLPTETPPTNVADAAPKNAAEGSAKC